MHEQSPFIKKQYKNITMAEFTFFLIICFSILLSDSPNRLNKRQSTVGADKSPLTLTKASGPPAKVCYVINSFHFYFFTFTFNFILHFCCKNNHTKFAFYFCKQFLLFLLMNRLFCALKIIHAYVVTLTRLLFFCIR